MLDSRDESWDRLAETRKELQKSINRLFDSSSPLSDGDFETLEQSLERTLKHIGIPQELYSAAFTLRATLDTESDRGCALMAAAYLDSELEALIRRILVDNPQVIGPLFQGHGPLSTFSARIDMGYLLGLYGSRVRRDLHLIRRIRNEFAHRVDRIDFDSPEIAPRCSELFYDAFREELPPRRKFLRVLLGVTVCIHIAAVNAERIPEARDLNVEDFLLPQEQKGKTS